MVDHPDCTLDDSGPRRNHCLCLLTAEHVSCNLGGVGEPSELGPHDLDAGHGELILQFLMQ